MTTKRTRKREFLDEMDRVIQCADLVGLITPHAPDGKRGRPRFSLEMMLRIHFMQQRFPLRLPTVRALTYIHVLELSAALVALWRLNQLCLQYFAKPPLGSVLRRAVDSGKADVQSSA